MPAKQTASRSTTNRAKQKQKSPRKLPAVVEYFMNRANEDSIARIEARDHLIREICDAIDAQHCDLLSIKDVMTVEMQLLAQHLDLHGAELVGACNQFIRVQHLRRIAGTSEHIENARRRLEAARAAENETSATIDDLEVNDEASSPALARQIAKLSAQLDELSRERRRAESNLQRVEQAYTQLRELAPDFLKNDALRKQNELKRADPRFEERRNVGFQLHQIRHAKALASGFGNGPAMLESNESVCAIEYCNKHCPSALDTQGSGKIINVSKFLDHVRDLEKRESELQAKRDELDAHCDRQMRLAESNIDEWMATGALPI